MEWSASFHLESTTRDPSDSARRPDREIEVRRLLALKPDPAFAFAIGSYDGRRVRISASCMPPVTACSAACSSLLSSGARDRPRQMINPWYGSVYVVRQCATCWKWLCR
jgi:hypothetical protein